MDSNSPTNEEHTKKNGQSEAIESDRARPATVGDGGRRLWLYPDRRPGHSASRRKLVAIFLIIFYFFAPYLSFNGIPLLRLDVLEGRASILGLTFRNNDGAYVVFGLLFFTFSLFLFTSIRGRIWCGYACPQTVFIEWVIRPIEEFLEGNSAHRRNTDSKPLTWQVALRKGIKQLIFLAVAALVSNTFLAYFVNPETLRHWIVSSPGDHPLAFGIMLFILCAFYFDLAWFREQFCAFLCPYARFQSVLMDRYTPTVSYDSGRGEPRGKGPDRGDCIDCKLCVRVCPTGIDIRNGLQLECIMCERCIDACNGVMANLQRPQNLIKIASQEQMSGKTSIRLWRGRVVIYFLALVAVIVGFSSALLIRAPVHFVLTRAPGSAFSQMPDGRISNIFNVHVANNRPRNVSLEFKLISPEGAQIICGQCAETVRGFAETRVNLIVLFNRKNLASDEFRIVHVPTGEDLSAQLLHP